MNWSLGVKLSAAAGATLTILEFSLAAHITGTVIEDHVALCRVFATTAVSVMALCLFCGLAGSLLSRFVGLSPTQGLAAGVVAATGPTALYLGGVDLAWDHDQYTLWFLIGIPLGFIVCCLMMRGAPPRLQRFVERIWPAIAPLAMLTGLAQELRQDVNLLGSPVAAAAGLWVIGVTSMLAAVRRWPGIGHALTGGAVAAALAVSIGDSVKPDLDRPSTVVAARPDAPPVVLLTIDTLRRDALSLYGAETPTPNIDALGRDGIVFDRAYSTAPWTYVALTSIHTGLSPWAHGVRDSLARVPEGAPAIGPMLRDQGYRSAAFGNNAWLAIGGGAYVLTDAFDDRNLYWRTLIPKTRAQSFWERTNPEVLGLNVTTRQIGAYGAGWIEHHKTGPSLLWLHFLDPHMPYDRVEEFPPSTQPPAEIGPLHGRPLQAEFGKWRQIPQLVDWARALYQSEVQLVDETVGSVLQTLKDNGLYDKALIVLTSDHGEEFTEHGNFGHGKNLYDALVRVPLIVKLPHSTTHARLVQPVSTAAVAPTIFDLAGVAYDEEKFSYPSLRGDWEEKPAGVPESVSMPVFMTGVFIGDPAEAVVWDDYKFIGWENSDHEELYDLQSDPNEQHDLIGKRPELADIGRALIADHARRETQRAIDRGFEATREPSLTPEQEGILRSLGYLQ